MMKKTLLAAAALCALTSGAAMAQNYPQDGKWMVRARAVHLDSANGGAAGDKGVSVNDKWIPELDISYFFTPNLAAELILTYPQKHDVRLGGTKIGSVKHLPPTLLAQYHFTGLGAFKPYVGAGINYTTFFDESVNDTGKKTGISDLSLKDSWGAAGQVGMDYLINRDWLINMSVWYMDIDTTANYKLGNLDKAQWTINPSGDLALDYTYNFSGVVDLMGIRFDYPEDQVISKRWLGAGPYRVWQNRIHGTQYDVWENDYNDPIPGETFTYPEFKGYFGDVSWMNIQTKEGTISLTNETPDTYIGVYQPRDGRDRLLYTLPESGISVLNVIPPVRNKVNSTDLCGPSSQPKWVNGPQTGRVIFRFM